MSISPDAKVERKNSKSGQRGFLGSVPASQRAKIATGPASDVRLLQNVAKKT